MSKPFRNPSGLHGPTIPLLLGYVTHSKPMPSVKGVVLEPGFSPPKPVANFSCFISETL